MHAELKLRRLNSDTLLLGYIDRRVNFVLGRFGARIGKVTARITPASDGGPQAVRCRMAADLHPYGLIEAEATDKDVYTAIDRSAGRLARRCESICGRSRGARTSRLSIRMPGFMSLAG